jgi:hypothetical protein
MLLSTSRGGGEVVDVSEACGVGLADDVALEVRTISFLLRPRAARWPTARSAASVTTIGSSRRPVFVLPGTAVLVLAPKNRADRTGGAARAQAPVSCSWPWSGRPDGLKMLAAPSGDVV